MATAYEADDPTPPPTIRDKLTTVWDEFTTASQDLSFSYGGLVSSGLSSSSSSSTASSQPLLTSIRVKGLGDISLPISEADLSRLKTHAQKAPFGKGSETILDENVRDAWQIDAKEISTPSQPNFLNQTVTEMARTVLRDHLHVDANAMGVEAHLYKMLIYEEGGHFLSHRDTEKAKGMFATYLLQVPVATGYAGGALEVRKGTIKRVYNFSTPVEEVSKNFYEVVFYADCEHELKAVKKGWRVVFAFNLIWKQLRPDKLNNQKMMVMPTGIAGMTHLISSLKQVEQEWFSQLDLAQQALVAFPLTHKYTEKNFSFKALKAEDSLLAQAVTTCFDSSRWEVYLYLEHRHVSGQSDGSVNSGRKVNGKIERNQPRHVMVEVFNTENDFLCIDYRTQTISHEPLPIDCRTDLVGDNSYYVDNDQARLLNIDYDNTVPDKEKYEGYTGNEGMGLEYWYNRALLVVFPRQFSDDLLDVRSNICGLVETALKKLEITGGWTPQRQVAHKESTGSSKKSITTINKSPDSPWLEQVVAVFSTSYESSQALTLSATVFPISVTLTEECAQTAVANNNPIANRGVKEILAALAPHMSHYGGQSEWFPLAMLASVSGSENFFHVLDGWIREKATLSAIFQRVVEEEGVDDMFISSVDAQVREKRMTNCIFYLASLKGDMSMVDTLKSWIYGLWDRAHFVDRMRYLLPLSRHLFNYCNLATKAQSVETETSSSSSSAAAVSLSDVTAFINCDAEVVANIRELDRYLLYDVIAKELFTTSGEAPWGHFSDSKPNRYYGHYDDQFEKENYYLTLCMYLLERCCGGGDREIVGRQSIVDETPDDFILESIRQRLQTNSRQSLFRVLLELIAAIPMSKQCLEPYQNSYYDRSSGDNDRITRSMISSALAMLRNCNGKVLKFLSQYVEDRLAQAVIQSLRDTLQKVKAVINMSMRGRGMSNNDNVKESLPDSAKELESNEPLPKKARKSIRK